MRSGSLILDICRVLTIVVAPLVVMPSFASLPYVTLRDVRVWYMVIAVICSIGYALAIWLHWPRIAYFPLIVGFIATFSFVPAFMAIWEGLQSAFRTPLYDIWTQSLIWAIAWHVPVIAAAFYASLHETKIVDEYIDQQFEKQEAIRDEAKRIKEDRKKAKGT